VRRTSNELFAALMLICVGATAALGQSTGHTMITPNELVWGASRRTISHASRFSPR
jgi:hypothetical protein